MDEQRLHEIRRPLDELECKLVERDLARPHEVSPELVAALRYVLSFARLTVVRATSGVDVDLIDLLGPHRWRVAEALRRHLEDEDPSAALWGAVRVLPELVVATREMRSKVVESTPLDREALDAEVCHRQLVVVCGGGGGSGYGYAGAYALLHRSGLVPELIAGTSIGALIGMFRARRRSFDGASLIALARRLSWNRVFKVFDADSRYGVPATLRLYLRSAIGDLFLTEGGRAITFRDLEVPLLAVATGLTVEGLKHDLDFYEHFLDDAVTSNLSLKPAGLVRFSRLLGVLRELMADPSSLKEIVFGSDETTLDADVIDAAGFSASVTGFIHYDIYRDDQRMKDLLDGLYALHGITRLTEGGLVNNVPVRPAWRQVMNGAIKRRNPYIIALDCFSPQRRSVMFYPIQQLVRLNVTKNIPFANLYQPLGQRLSPLNLLPSPEHLIQAMRWTMDELEDRMPLVQAICTPLPVLRG